MSCPNYWAVNSSRFLFSFHGLLPPVLGYALLCWRLTTGVTYNSELPFIAPAGLCTLNMDNMFWSIRLLSITKIWYLKWGSLSNTVWDTIEHHGHYHWWKFSDIALVFHDKQSSTENNILRVGHREQLSW